MKLNEIYNLKLLNYKKYSKREQMDKLLAMLLLPERDNFKPLKVTEGEFYQKYKTEIDEKIQKVISDFEITDEEIIKQIEDKGVSCDNFEDDKIWFVFCEGFGAMHWGLMYHPEKSPEEIYNYVFGLDLNDLSLDINQIISKGTKISTEEALEDVTPINWSKEVLDGNYKGKVLIKNK